MPTDRDLAALKETLALARAADERANAYRALAAREAARLIAAETKKLPPDEARLRFAARVGALEGLPADMVAVEAAKKPGAAPAEVFAFDKERKIKSIAVCPGRQAAFAAATWRGAVTVEASGFENACELTADGDADGALLPLNDADGLPLSGVRRLCRAYGLKAQAVVRTADGTRFGLFVSGLAPADDADTLELTLHGGDEGAYLRLFGRCGLMAEGTRENGTFFVTVRGEGARIRSALDAAAFLPGEAQIEGFYADPDAAAKKAKA